MNETTDDLPLVFITKSSSNIYKIMAGGAGKLIGDNIFTLLIVVVHVMAHVLIRNWEVEESIPFLDNSGNFHSSSHFWTKSSQIR